MEMPYFGSAWASPEDKKEFLLEFCSVYTALEIKGSEHA